MEWIKITNNYYVTNDYETNTFFECQTKEEKSQCERIIGNNDIFGIMYTDEGLTFLQMVDAFPDGTANVIGYYFMNGNSEIAAEFIEGLDLPDEVLEKFI